MRSAPDCKRCGAPIIWTHREGPTGRREWVPTEPPPGLTEEQRANRVAFAPGLHREHACGGVARSSSTTQSSGAARQPSPATSDSTATIPTMLLIDESLYGRMVQVDTGERVYRGQLKAASWGGTAIELLDDGDVRDGEDSFPAGTRHIILGKAIKAVSFEPGPPEPPAS